MTKRYIIVDMMEVRLRREIDRADDPFSRHMACLMLEYYLTGRYDFWMEKGDIVWSVVDPGNNQ
tara:strand:+ start:164 stop:355 length:192 start_codon:yes stop_codon:yes gene_type:complete